MQARAKIAEVSKSVQKTLVIQNETALSGRIIHLMHAIWKSNFFAITYAHEVRNRPVNGWLKAVMHRSPYKVWHWVEQQEVQKSLESISIFTNSCKDDASKSIVESYWN